MSSDGEYSEESFEDYDEEDFEEFDDEGGQNGAVAAPGGSVAAAGARPRTPPFMSGAFQAGARLAAPPGVGLATKDDLAEQIRQQNQAIQHRLRAQEAAAQELVRPSTAARLAANRPASAGLQTRKQLPRADALVVTDAMRKLNDQQSARARDLKDRIHLSIGPELDMFEMRPLSDYQLLQMGRGPFATRVFQGTQTHTRDSQETQTVRMADTEHQACQAPEDFGEDAIKAAKDASAGVRPKKKKGGGVIDEVAELHVGRDVGMRVSILRGAAIVCRILDERKLRALPPRFASNAVHGGAKPLPATAGPETKLSWPAGLHDRPVAGMALAQGTRPMLLCAYGACPGGNDRDVPEALRADGRSCVWDLSTAPRTPAALLVSEGVASCCCWGPGTKPWLALVGMEEGGICAYDLREPANEHAFAEVAGATVAARRPTYTTEAEVTVAHTAAIVGLRCLPAPGRAQSAGDDDAGFRPGEPLFMVVSLDAWGGLAVWYAVQTLAPVEGGVSRGIRPGGLVCLVQVDRKLPLGIQQAFQSSQAALEAEGRRAALAQGAPEMPTALERLAAIAAGRRAFGLATLAGAGGGVEVLAALDGARVAVGGIGGSVVPPREFVAVERWLAAKVGGANATAAFGEDACEVPAAAAAAAAAGATDCTSLHASPFLRGHFVAGFSDGSIAVFSRQRALPLLIAAGGGAAVVSVRWSPCRPAQLLSLDAESTLCLWDLRQSRTRPVTVEKVTRFQKDAEYQATGRPATACALEVSAAGAEHPMLLLGLDDGRVECHKLIGDEAGGSVEGEAEQVLQLLRQVDGSMLS
ncbi:unnamed protein product [Pedinophyceae sp. YPF-701]|nr:unnamed protein product [Pedinophyceae sp. YPF-701]